jgi:glucose 1-dehydrogenase
MTKRLEGKILASYLASEDADYVTGQSFTIDGGFAMNQGQGA